MLNDLDEELIKYLLPDMEIREYAIKLAKEVLEEIRLDSIRIESKKAWQQHENGD